MKKIVLSMVAVATLTIGLSADEIKANFDYAEAFASEQSAVKRVAIDFGVGYDGDGAVATGEIMFAPSNENNIFLAAGVEHFTNANGWEEELTQTPCNSGSICEPETKRNDKDISFSRFSGKVIFQELSLRVDKEDLKMEFVPLAGVAIIDEQTTETKPFIGLRGGVLTKLFDEYLGFEFGTEFTDSSNSKTDFGFGPLKFSHLKTDFDTKNTISLNWHFSL